MVALHESNANVWSVEPLHNRKSQGKHGEVSVCEYFLLMNARVFTEKPWAEKRWLGVHWEVILSSSYGWVCFIFVGVSHAQALT